MIYLDNAATTRPFPCAAEAVRAALTDHYFNPAANYSPAVQTDRLVRAAREHLAAVLSTAPEEILFTSGATESNNTAIRSVLKKARGRRRVISTRTEHPSVYEVLHSLESDPDTEVVYIGTNPDGSASLSELKEALTPDTALVTLMHVNNETGSVTDLAAASALIRSLAPGAVFHSDGVQAFCKLPFGPLPCDLYSLSGHKFHAPKGIGALYVRRGVPFVPFLEGGGQESGRRSGTTNVPGILGMDAALSEYRAHQSEWIAAMRALKVRMAENLLTVPDTFINGPAPEEGSPQILSVAFPGVGGEVLLNAMSEKGICLSTGSACSSKKKGANRVLTAMGIPPARQDSTVRISFCPENTAEEIDEAAGQIREAVLFLRKFKRR